MNFIFLNLYFVGLFSLFLLIFVPPGSILLFQVSSFLLILLFNIFLKKFIQFKIHNFFSYNLKLYIEPIIFLFIATFFFFFRFSQEPFGMWDAWAMWNAKSKDFTLDFIEGHHFQFYRETWAHPGYPILIPLQISFIGINIGKFTEVISYLINYLYIILFWFMMIKDYSQYSNSYLYKLVTFFPFLLNGLINLASDLCADFPLSIYFCYVVYLILYHKDFDLYSKKYYHLILGLSIGILPLIKNEGIFFSFFITIAFFIKFFKEFNINKFLLFLLGISFPFIFVVYYKINAPEFNPVPITKDHLLNVLINWERYMNILLAELILNVYTLYLFVPIILIYFLYKKYKLSYLYTIILCLHLTVDFIFLITSSDQVWHLQTAYLRLNLQLVPAFFLITQNIIKEKLSKEISDKKITNLV